MSNQRRHYYLKHLGLEPWVLRTESPQNENKDNLFYLESKVAQCSGCTLHKTRKNTVFARGNAKAPLMIIGEAPEHEDELQGAPFVGKSGQLLNRMLQSIGYDDTKFYITNVLKCRPSNDCAPQHAEIMACRDFLHQQILLVAPKLILALGRNLGLHLMEQSATFEQLRLDLHDYHGIPVIVSYHPLDLLQHPSDKKHAYHDLLKVKVMLDHE